MGSLTLLPKPYLGHGKTSIMAKAVSLIKNWLDGHGNGAQAVILRFLGTSPRSCSISQLLSSLCHQIAYACGEKR